MVMIDWNNLPVRRWRLEADLQPWNIGETRIYPPEEWLVLEPAIHIKGLSGFIPTPRPR